MKYIPLFFPQIIKKKWEFVGMCQEKGNRMQEIYGVKGYACVAKWNDRCKHETIRYDTEIQNDLKRAGSTEVYCLPPNGLQEMSFGFFRVVVHVNNTKDLIVTHLTVG